MSADEVGALIAWAFAGLTLVGVFGFLAWTGLDERLDRLQGEVNQLRRERDQLQREVADVDRRVRNGSRW